MDYDPWLVLDHELDAWARNGDTADFWWRDDDAIAPGPKLDRLISITGTTGLLLAVVPANAEKALASVVESAPHVAVAQHGYAHINHAPRGQGLGAWELGLHRDAEVVLEELEQGHVILRTLFGERFIPVIVPPWNRLDPALIPCLSDRGYCGVSRFGPRDTEAHSSGFSVVNSHCDPIRWKTGACFRGESKTINQLVDHLRARRNAEADVDEPTGYLTHHIDLDEEGWAFSEKLVQRVNQHAAARWCTKIPPLFCDQL
ncbi:hypothetical protein AB833_21350 [Chromatiales bacterium (ex Bugula neritina AB1)]|nr:hypothetical protein AB833_21350 [Chromatiales bacterium (ex Bugula neritina AB1)]